MDDIKALEARITAALDRIGAGLPPPGTAQVIETLKAELLEERYTTTQLEAQIKKEQSGTDGRLADLQDRIARQAEQLAALDSEMQQLRGSNADLTQLCAQLRHAAEAGSTDPELINRALMAEVDGLTAQRHAEATEVAAILSDLKPLLQKEG